jgi:hypothetical protein
MFFLKKQFFRIDGILNQEAASQHNQIQFETLIQEVASQKVKSFFPLEAHMPQWKRKRPVSGLGRDYTSCYLIANHERMGNFAGGQPGRFDLRHEYG